MTIELPRLAYSIANFAKAVDLSETTIRDAIRDGDLIPAYVNSKPLITSEEGRRWLGQLPAERAS